MTSRRFTRVLLLAVAAGAAAGAEPPPAVSLDEALAARRPHPVELETEARIATAKQRLAGSSGMLLHGATLSAAAGPRRVEGEAGSESSTDLALGLDVPLLFAKDEQRALAAAIDEAAPPMRAAARATAELETELAFLVAWRDAEEAALRDRELALVDDWLAATRRRVEAGAEPPYQATVAAGERQRVAVERDQARARALSSRLALEALSALPAGGSTLLEPPPKEAVDPAEEQGITLLKRALELGVELEIADAALDAAGDASRWSLASELASEGDEEVARLGLAYRIAPRRQRSSAAEALAAVTAALRRGAALEAAAVDGRIATARRVLDNAPAAVSASELAHAFEALAALVTEGKERPTALLAERRALVDAQLALLESRHARLAARAELRTLTRRVEP